MTKIKEKELQEIRMKKTTKVTKYQHSGFGFS